MTKRKRLAFTIGLAAAALGFFALCALTPYYGDDYSYMFTYAADTPKIRITNLQELYLSQLNHYQIMNGRAIVHTLVQLLLMPDGRELFCLLDTLVFLALGFAVYYAAYGTLRRFKPLSLFAAWALIFLSLPAFGQSCLWLTGAVNYMWTTFAALCFLLPYRSDGSGGDRAALRTIGMPFLGVLAGWSGENACIAAALGLVLLLVRRRLLRLPFRAWMWTGVIGFSAGAAALFLSPGAQGREHGRHGRRLDLDFPHTERELPRPRVPVAAARAGHSSAHIEHTAQPRARLQGLAEALLRGAHMVRLRRRRRVLHVRRAVFPGASLVRVRGVLGRGRARGLRRSG